MNSERIARDYIAASNRCDYEAMADLFHPNAEWIPIASVEPRRGRDAIRERYLADVRPMNAPIVNVRYTADQERCVATFDVEHPEHGLVSIVDVFDIDVEGHITRLSVYRK